MPPRTRHKLNNLAHSAILIGGMVSMAAFGAWLLWGVAGVLWAIVVVTVTLIVSPRIPPQLVLRMYGARPISASAFPQGHLILEELSARADLPAAPGLYYIPSATLNAFSLGNRQAGAIAVSDGLLRVLSQRELAAVLAHEVSHIANNDLWIMNLADVLSRTTSILSFTGLFLLILNVPLLFVGAETVSWLLIAVLAFAPTIMSLLQLALSRAREYDADLDAASLTGNPKALASALTKLERYQGRFWEDILLPGRRIPEPSLLRTHPPTEERVRRLLELVAPPRPAWRTRLSDDIHVPAGFSAVRREPRWRRSGMWY